MEQKKYGIYEVSVKLMQAKYKKCLHKYRKYGVFFKLIEKLREENQEIKIVSCATGHDNKRMQRILKYYGGHEINLIFYYKKV